MEINTFLLINLTHLCECIISGQENNKRYDTVKTFIYRLVSFTPFQISPLSLSLFLSLSLSLIFFFHFRFFNRGQILNSPKVEVVRRIYHTYPFWTFVLVKLYINIANHDAVLQFVNVFLEMVVRVADIFVKYLSQVMTYLSRACRAINPSFPATVSSCASFLIRTRQPFELVRILHHNIHVGIKPYEIIDHPHFITSYRHITTTWKEEHGGQIWQLSVLSNNGPPHFLYECMKENLLGQLPFSSIKNVVEYYVLSLLCFWKWVFPTVKPNPQRRGRSTFSSITIMFWYKVIFSMAVRNVTVCIWRI